MPIQFEDDDSSSETRATNSAHKFRSAAGGADNTDGEVCSKGGGKADTLTTSEGTARITANSARRTGERRVAARIKAGGTADTLTTSEGAAQITANSCTRFSRCISCRTRDAYYPHGP